MTRRLLDPLQAVRDHGQRAAGVVSQRDLARQLVGINRYDDRAVPKAEAIGFAAPTAGADQSITTTGFTLVTGSGFPVSLAGDASWLVDVSYLVVIDSTGAVDDEVYARIFVDFANTGDYKTPDIDRSTEHGIVTAFAQTAYAESAGTGVGFSLNPRAVFKVRGGSTFKIGVGVRVGTSQTAVVELTDGNRVPRCVGFALPFVDR